MAAFAHRGLVEGYYGREFDHEDRLWLIERLGAWGMTREALARFETLVARGRRAGVEVGFALSPGLSIRYSDSGDLSALVQKLRAFEQLGARFFGLALDDVPSELAHEADRRAYPSLAAAHVALAHAVRDALDPDALLYLVPTDYVGSETSDYLETLGAELDPSIEVGWAGRTVMSPRITAQEAARRAGALGRRLLLWDNVPVNDGPMRPMLHLGPYSGRDPELATHLSGALLNPMEQPRASGIALRTAADYLRDPRGYSPERSWHAAIEECGGGAADAFLHFARAHRFSPSLPKDRDVALEAGLDALRNAYEDDSSPNDALAGLADLLEPRARAAEKLRSNLADRRLAAEIEPWLEAHETECQRMSIALDFLEALEAASASAMDRVLAFSRFEGRLTHLATPKRASFGPRRVLYPQLACLTDEGARYAEDPALFVDYCIADEFVALAEARAARALGAPRHEG